MMSNYKEEQMKLKADIKDRCRIIKCKYCNETYGLRKIAKDSYICREHWKE
jgi:hypothetical protein